MNFTLTQDSLVVVVDGEPISIRKDAANFEAARAAILREDWDAVPALVSPGVGIERWLGHGFSLKNNLIMFGDSPVDAALNSRLLNMYQEGAAPAGWLKFWKRLQSNPSFRSVRQLYGFMAHVGIPIDSEGYILAYKSVRQDYKDHYSNSHDNSPGSTHEMPRNQISDDPNVACHEGFHVGALEYARGFGSSDRRIIVCKVDPADVVCVPYDHAQQKMRVCRYEVLGNFSGEALPSTIFIEGDEEDEDDEIEDDEIEDDEIEDEIEDETEDETEDDEIDDEIDETPVAVKTQVSLDTTSSVASVTPSASTKDWSEYDAMQESDLLKVLFPDLRKYARHGLHIVGASKMKGTKTDLVRRILEVRRK